MEKIIIKRKALIATDHKLTRVEKKAIKDLLKKKLDKYPIIVFPSK